MTAAILSIAIRPAIAGLAESFGSAGTMAGGVMGGLAGETLSRLLLEHGKKGGAAAGAATADEFNEQFKAGYSGGRALKEVAAESGDAFTGLGGKLAANVMGEFNKVVAGQKLDLGDLMKPFEMLENAAVGPIMAITNHIPLLGGALRSMKSDFDTATAGAADFMQTMIDVGDTYIEATRKIAAATVDSSQLEGLTTAVRDIMDSGAIVHFDDVASAIGRLNTNISNLSSEQLKELTTNFAYAEELVGKIDPTKFAGVVNAWGIGAEHANDFLTQLTNTARITGQGMDQMANEMQQVGPSMRAFGYDAGQTAQFFAQMTKEGEPAQKAVFMWTHAFSEATKAGVDPKTWLEMQLGAIKSFAKSGDMEEAAKLFEKAFGQRATPLLLEDVNKGLLDLPAMMKPLAGIDEPLKKGVEETASLGDAFEKLGQQIKGSLEPVGIYMAKGLVEAGNQLSGWLAENQDKIVRWATEAVQVILKGAQDFLRWTGDALVAFSGFVNSIKEVVTGFFQFIIGPFKGLIDAFAALPSWAGGDLFKGAKESIDDAYNGLTKINSIDMGHTVYQWGEQLRHLSDDVPGLSQKVGEIGERMAQNLEITKAFTENINGELKPAFDQMRDKSGQLIQGTPEAPFNLQLQGSPAQWADIANKLHQQGIDIKTNTAGVISAITFANDEAHDKWNKWYEEANKKGTPVNVTLNPKDKDGKDITSPADLVPPGGAGVGVTVLPKGVSGYSGGIPIPTYSPLAPGGQHPSLPPSGGIGGSLPVAPSLGPAAPPQAGDTALQSALRAKGFTPEQIRLVQGFSQTEGLNPAGNPTLGFKDVQLGGDSSLQAHVDALAQQFKDRASVAGPFPAGGSDRDQANWIANVVGQSGSPSDIFGEKQPAREQYVQSVISGMQGIPRAGPGAAAPSGTPSNPVNVVPAPGAAPPLPAAPTGPGVPGAWGAFLPGATTPHAGTGALPGPGVAFWGALVKRPTVPTHPKDAYSVPEDQFNDHNPPPAPDGAKGWQYHKETKSWIAVDNDGNPVKGPPPAQTPPPPKGRTSQPPAIGAGPLTAYVNTPRGLVPVQGGGQLGGFPVPPSVAQGAVGMKVPSISVPDSPLYGLVGGKGGYSQRSLGEILGGPPGSGPSADLGSLLSGAVGPAGGLPKGLQPIYGPPVLQKPKLEDLFGPDVGGRQGGGDIPWLPGTQWGMDGVMINAAPGEHVWSAPEVAAAGGHHEMAKMRSAALNGKLPSYQPGGPVGGSGVEQVIWDNPMTGSQVGEAGGKIVGPGTDQPGYYRDDWMGHTGHVHTSFSTSPTGEFYGLPVGTDIRPGAPGFPDWVYALGAQYGLQPSTYAGHQEGSGYNRGIDWWPAGAQDMSGKSYSAPQVAALQSFAENVARAGASGTGGGGQTFLAGSGIPGSGGTGGQGSAMVGPGGPSDPNYFSPFSGPQPDMSGRQRQEWITGTERWQESRISAGTELNKSQEAYRAALDAATSAQNQFNIDAAKAASLPEAQRGAMKAQLDAEAAKVSETGKTFEDAKEAMRKATDNYTIAMGTAPPKPPSAGGEGQYESMSQQLGQGIIKGLFQGLGFPDVFGKPFTEWGIMKLAMGGAGWGLNMLNRIGQEGGGPAGSGGSGGGLGSLLPGLVKGAAGPGLNSYFKGPGMTGEQIPPGEQKPGLFPGFPGFGGMPGSPQSDVGPAAMESQTPVQTPAGDTSTFSPSLSITHNYEGVMAPPKIDQTVNDSVVNNTGMTATSGGAGTPGG